MTIHFTITKGDYLTIVNPILSLHVNEYMTCFHQCHLKVIQNIGNAKKEGTYNKTHAHPRQVLIIRLSVS